MPKPYLESTDNDKHIQAARKLAADTFAELHTVSADVTPDLFYVVGFMFILGGWKAQVSTDFVPGFYYEVTYNSAKQEAYVDEYRKQHNRAVPASDF